MKKFISLFLVISIIMCNINVGVVGALSTYTNEVKSLINTLINNDDEKIIDVEKDEQLYEKEVQVKENNETENTEVVESKKEENQVEKLILPIIAMEI